MAQDPGVDIAVVNAEEGTILTPERGQPQKNLKRGTLLGILSGSPNVGSYQVVEISSGNVGRVSAQGILLQRTKLPKTISPIRELPTPSGKVGSKAVTLEVQNIGTLKVRLHIGTTEFTLMPGASKSLNLASGETAFWAVTPDSFPVVGSKKMTAGRHYIWQFAQKNRP